MYRLIILLALAATSAGCGDKEVAGRVAKDGAPNQAEAPLGAKKDAANAGAKPVERKILYTAQVDLIVDDLDASAAKLLELVKDRKAYVAKSDVRGTPGAPRSATWTVCVPAERFDDLRDALAKLGELRHANTDSNDVTDAYYDLEAHIKNDQAREEGLRKLYVERAAGSKLEDLLAVDRELSALRGKIDAQKGQLQRWDKEVAYSTVTVTMVDRRDYVSPIVPNFGGQVGRAFQQSVEALVSFGKFLVLTVVMLAPWLIVLGVVVVPAWYLVRRRRRTR